MLNCTILQNAYFVFYLLVSVLMVDRSCVDNLLVTVLFDSHTLQSAHKHACHCSHS